MWLSKSSRRPRAARRQRSALSLLRLEERVTPTFGVTNLSLAASSSYLVSGDMTAFQVAESEQGADLNGDLDSSDTVLHVYDAATGSTTNLGLAIQPFFFNISGNLVVLDVMESAQGDGSLNGDGDTSDLVLHLYDAATGAITNLGFAAFSFQFSGNRLAFSVQESAQGAGSLNGDGDATDTVVHFYDAATAATTNLGLATLDGFQFTGDLLAISVREFQQGGISLNGDGDAADSVIHIYSFTTAATTNLGLAVGGLAVSENLVAFQVPESGQGNTNLNGDGDTGDFVLHIYDAATATTSNRGLAAGGLAVNGNLVAFRVPESNQGNTILNGDGDTADLVVHVYDAGATTTTNLGLAIANFEFLVDGSLVALRIPEPIQGGDLNGDGDAIDSVVHVYDAATTTLTNLGLASAEIRLSGNLVAFRVVESAQGATDFNGDGDATDGVVLVYDAATAGTTILAAATFVDAEGNLVAYTVSEFGQGATDFNGDGDISDAVVHVYDAATASATNLGLASGGFIRLSGELLAFPVRELGQGATDLNGDGDILDLVAHVAEVTANVAPVNTVPAAQQAAEDVTLVFSAANGNAISISDSDAGNNDVQVTLSATNGTLSLVSTTGLSFSTGDGSGDVSMTFTGSQADINAALNGLAFAPTHNFNGAAILSITTNDLGHSGSGGALSDTDSVSIAVLSVPQQIGNVKESVNDLVAASTLNWGQGNALTTKLDHALEKYQLGQFHTAVNVLNAFIHQVQAFIASGILSAANGNGLIAAVNNIIVGIQT